MSKDEPIHLNSEHTEYRWVKKNEFSKLDLVPAIRTAMDTLL